MDETPQWNPNGRPLLRCSLDSVAITIHTWQQEDSTPNNVAEELSPELPSQIGSVASTQLGLKYGNGISHYKAVEMVRGELLKVRRGYALGVICCAELCLHSREKKHHDAGTAQKWKKKLRRDEK